MGNPRPRPARLPEKLLAIREFLNLDRADMARELQSQLLSHCRRRSKIEPTRIWEYETGVREPNLFVLIAYSRLGQVHMESLVDDDIDEADFFMLLGGVTLSHPSQRRRRNKPIPLINGTR